MTEQEHQPPRPVGTEPPAGDPYQQRELDVPSLATALRTAAEERLDRHLGRGVVFPLGQEPRSSLELYPQIVRVTLPQAQLVVPRTEAEVVPEGVVFQDRERFLLSVGPTGDVLFQYSPPAPAATSERDSLPELAQSLSAEPPPSPPSAPAPVATELKPRSEKYIGRMAEVELTVPDPQRPGASQLLKFAAFGAMAETLRNNYHPGQEVTAVGIPHELKRRSREGRDWTERQLYFVQPPKPRERP